MANVFLSDWDTEDLIQIPLYNTRILYYHDHEGAKTVIGSLLDIRNSCL